MIHIPKRELYELLKAWGAIALAFGLVLRPVFDMNFGWVIVISAITVGIGFLIHELAHKFAANYFGKEAFFKADNNMLILAVLMGFIGFVFAAPGAVYIRGLITKRQNGIISIVGPISNLLLAFLFVPFMFLGGFLFIIGIYGFFINSWLGLFNMIPVWQFDGAKIWRWNRLYYVMLTFVLLVMSIIGGLMI